ncbi:hypothetical protein [Calidifontibacter indicus]|uniref:hypothetical protein n=1 Tax=Calidifontibacter indicus TaxID=419650 RepID=UPI003D74D509
MAYNGQEAYTVTVDEVEPEVKVAYDDQAFLGVKPGEHWARIKTTVCPKQTAKVNWFMFSLIDTNGGTYKGLDTSFHDPFPKPLLPDEINGIPAGPCRTGWVYVPVTDDTTFTSVVFQDGEAAVTWDTSK